MTETLECSTLFVADTVVFGLSDCSVSVWQASSFVASPTVPLSHIATSRDNSNRSVEDTMIAMLSDFVAIRSVSAEPALADECTRAANWLDEELESMGAKTKLVCGAAGCCPMVLGRLEANPEAPTVMFYGHYDVVPVGIEAAWNTDPFTLTGKDGYLYARGVTDNKGPIVATLFAVQQLLAECGEMPVNITFAYEVLNEHACIRSRIFVI